MKCEEPLEKWAIDPFLKDWGVFHTKLRNAPFTNSQTSIPCVFVTLDDILDQTLSLKGITFEMFHLPPEFLPKFIHRKKRKNKKPPFLFGFYDKRIQYVKLFFRGGDSGRSQPIVIEEVMSIHAFQSRYFFELL